ncbi:probable aspartic proteinase GIP2 [Malania oleifera]|uniref:probable aspartic proteinase GIP2 n=1 Tax=Malania oleifera TaxID=397392 RepID=UPI0025AEA60D|nr:probable aspartic proteinase GIP2 [Malania oleifera]
MASSFHLLLLSFLLLFSSSSSEAKTSSQPRALILPVSKDSSSLQYLTRIHQRTPLRPITLTLDLGGKFLWLDCDRGYVSSSYRPARCGSSQCSLARSGGCGDCTPPARPGCNNDTCSVLPGNTVTQTGTMGELAEDTISIQTTDGFNPGRAVSVPRFLFSCGATFLLKGLAKGAKGMVGLGRTKMALPSQFASYFGFHKTFAVCLSSSARSNGVIFFGDSPYNLLPNVDASKSLVYTPLFINPVSTAPAYFEGEPSSEYFIHVKAIKINGKVVPLNTTLLSINADGIGGTKISTVNQYTIMETSIYKAVAKAFTKELRNITRVTPVAPFEECFNSKGIISTRVGPSVPSVDLVLQKESVYWRIFGANSVVQAKDDVLCLGFLDGGRDARTSIVIGGHQIEDNLLQFDLKKSRLGFSSSLLFARTTCSNFNFTSNA